jgi:hypothetical protein
MRPDPGEPLRRLPDVRIARAAAVLLVVIPVACGIAPTRQPGMDGSTKDAEFELRIHADKPLYRTGEPIAVDAELVFTGLAPDTSVAGLFPRIVAFGVKQLDGHLATSPVSDLMCTAVHGISRLAPLHAPFRKSGGFTGDDPDAAFWRQYFADSDLHLPPGTWQISAFANFSTGDACTPPLHSLTAAVTVQVLP